MTVQIESSSKVPSIVIEKVAPAASETQTQHITVQQTKEIIHYVRPNYNVSIVDAFGGFFIMLGAILLVIKLAGGNDFFGSLIRGVATVVGGAVLFVYCFGMAIL